jgi:hypothetical protein
MTDEPQYNYWIDYDPVTGHPSGTVISTTGTQDFGLPVETDEQLAVWIDVLKADIFRLYPSAQNLRLMRVRWFPRQQPERVRELSLS